MSTLTQDVHDLVRRWVAAERGNDDAALGELAAADFHLVGPAGFVLTRTQWTRRYASGDLRTAAFDWEPTGEVREYGSCAVAIGVVTQQAAYQGRPADGRFRVTVIAVTDDGHRRLAGLQYSPIARPAAG